MPLPYRLFIISVVLILFSCSSSKEEGVGSEVGMIAPELSGILPNGEKFNLKDLRGELVVLDFWGTWCGPCLREAPDLVKLQNDLSQHLQVVSIALEKTDDGRSEAVAERLGFTWSYRLTEKIAFVRLSKIAGAYGVSDLPSSFLIDENGVILLARSSVKEIRSYMLDLEKSTSK
ncbi:MAG: TlpA disulfide reductase family protein [Bacteroidetes bacterium]|nr:TlpA disulfide reductase family protein [Bacteroidota bacterium]